MIQKPDGIIFDLDGTLWDSCESVAKAWKAATDQVDYVSVVLSADDIRAVAGTRHDLIFKQRFPNLSEDKLQEFMEICSREELAHIKAYGGELYEELEPTLAYLSKKNKLFIVSNCQDGYIETFLDRYNFRHYFQDYECSGRTRNNKGENVKDIIERNNLKTPVYVGDTPGDREAAVFNSIPFIHAAYGFQKVEQADGRLQKFSDLTTLF